MFAALTGWYTGCERNRRRYPRVKRDFDVEYTLDGERWDFAQGVDLSGGGMCMIGYRTISPDVFEARIDLGGRMLPMRVRNVWSTTTEHHGKELPFYGLQFDRIDPKDWETVMQSITGRSSLPAERFEPLPLNDADADRLLPAEFRNSVIRALQSRSRIDVQRPQVVYEYSGILRERTPRAPVHRPLQHQQLCGAQALHDAHSGKRRRQPGRDSLGAQALRSRYVDDAKPLTNSSRIDQHAGRPPVDVLLPHLLPHQVHAFPLLLDRHSQRYIVRLDHLPAIVWIDDKRLRKLA